MKKSIVLEIQKLATEKKQDIADLLRKALFVATKLKLNDFREWIDNELNGYRTGPVPEYRKVRATVELKNPYHGLIPVIFPSREIMDIFCNVEVRDPIGNLVSILEGQTSDKTNPIYPLTPEQEIFLVKHQNGGLGLPPIRTISYSAIASIIDLVRTQILEWSLKLEERGILGKGMTFSNDEKEIAMKTQEINIKNFQGILGNVIDSAVSQNLTMQIKSNDFEALANYLRSIGIANNDISDLEKALQKDPPPSSKDKFGKKVSAWMGKMISKAADGSWQVGIATAGNILAKAIGAYYGF